MAGVTAQVEVRVNHIMHRSGAIETREAAEQQVDPQRMQLFLDGLAALMNECGFAKANIEILQSANDRDGHYPEVHIVAVQLPSWLVDDLRKMREARP